MLSKIVTMHRRSTTQVFKCRYSSVKFNTICDKHLNVQPFEEIPGPKCLPVLGNALHFFPKLGKYSGINFHELLDQLHDEYGNIVKLKIPGQKKMVVISEPDDVEKVFRNEDWPIRYGLRGLKYYREVTRKDQFQGITGLAALQGEKWQTFRTKVNQPMLQPKTSKFYISFVDEVAKDFIKRVEIIKDENKEMPDDFINELQKWALESIAVIGLDTRLGCLQDNLEPDSEAQRMIDAVQIVFEGFEKLDFRIPFWKIISTPFWRNVSMKYINKALAEMKECSDREPSMLQRVLARDSDKQTALLMVLDMLTAGIDTTSFAAANTLYLLAQNQDKQQKLYEEIQSLIDTYGNNYISSDHIDNARYLKATVKESLRKLPISPAFDRVTTKEFVLSNYMVPKDVQLMVSVAVMCQQEEYFPEAKKFIPERWLKNGYQDIKCLHPFVYLPFGFGTRMCIGRRLAEMEIEVLLIRLIQKYRVEYHYGEMKFKAMPLLQPALPLKLKLVERKQSHL